MYSSERQITLSFRKLESLDLQHLKDLFHPACLARVVSWFAFVVAMKMLKGDLPLLDSLIAYFVNLPGDRLPEICRKSLYRCPKTGNQLD